jgi:A/G-specific adenine glycosylase
MELGALVCTPKQPRCGECPLKDLCGARAHDTVARFPRAKVKREVPTVDAVTVLVERKPNELLLARRPPQGLWGGLWEPPTVELDAPPTPTRARTIARTITGLALEDLEPVTTLEHVLTHRRMRFHTFRARGRGKPTLGSYDAARWTPLADTTELGLASWTTRLLKALRKVERS